MRPEPEEILDLSEAYHRWDELSTFGMKMALSTTNDSPEERKEALQRLLRGNQRALEERDVIWERILSRYFGRG